MYLLVNKGSTPDTPQSVMKNDAFKVNTAASGYIGNSSDYRTQYCIRLIIMEITCIC